MSKDFSDIVFVNECDLLKPGPSAIASVMMCHAMAQAGYRVTLLIAGKAQPRSARMLEERFGLTTTKNFTITAIPHGWGVIGKLGLLFYVRACRAILALARGARGKLIVMTGSIGFLPFLPALRFLTKSKALFETHGYHGRKIAFDKLRQLDMATLPLFLIEQLCLTKIDGIVCIARPQQRLYRLEFPKVPSVYLPLGARGNMRDAAPSNWGKRNRIAFVGRATPDIDCEALFGAMTRLRHREIALSWIGADRAGTAGLSVRARRGGIIEQVEFSDWLGHADLLDLLSREFGIGLACYKSSFHTAQLACPAKILDYFSAGIPVVASRMPAIEGLLKDGAQGFLYTPHDDTSLARAIGRLLDIDEKEYLRMRSSCLHIARQYSWENRAKLFLAFAQAGQTAGPAPSRYNRPMEMSGKSADRATSIS